MVTCSPRNATLVWPQHTAAESQLLHANEGTESVVNRGGKRARMRTGEVRRESVVALSGRHGLCQLMMIVFSPYTCTHTCTLKVQHVSVVYVWPACTCLSVRRDDGVVEGSGKKRRAYCFLFVFQLFSRLAEFSLHSACP